MESVKVLKNAVTSKVGRQILITQKHSPQILFVGGIVGIVGTTVLACRATLKIDALLEDHQKSAFDISNETHPGYSDSDRKRDQAYVYARTVSRVAKLYAPAVGLGVVSIGALTGSHVVLSKRNVAVTAAYGALEKGFNEYRQRVIDDVGSDKDRDYRYGAETTELVEVTKKGEKTRTVTRVKPGDPSVYARYFDEFSQEWSRQPEYNLIFLKCQQNYANDLLHARGHVFLNEIYDMLGIERTKAGAVVGWLITKEQGDNFIDFGVFDETRERARDFVNGREGSILLDFNVDGMIYDKI